MISLRVRLTIWFCASFLVVCGMFIGLAYWHINQELHIAKWQHEHPNHSDWTLHGSYSDAEVRDIVGELIKGTLLASVPMIFAAIAAGLYLARKSTEPFANLNAQLRNISSSNLGVRIHLADADPDILSVEEHINKLLDRLEISFNQLQEFSSKVAHELRSPLTLMRLKIEHAAGKIEPELSETLQDELKRLSEYVNQALLMARAEQKRLELKFERLDFGRFLEEMIDVYRVLASIDDRTIEMKCRGSFSVEADCKYLCQILHNLLTNALKHGHGRIVIRVRHCRGRVVCAIANGVSTLPSHSENGFGLGLRVASALISLHPGMHFRTRLFRNAYSAHFAFAASPIVYDLFQPSSPSPSPSGPV